MLYLASRSPRRRSLLSQLGVAFESIDVDVPEIRDPGECPRAYVARVARAKMRAGVAAVGVSDTGALVLGADTEVVLADRVFGKPADAATAAAMLAELSGRTHRVVSVVCCAGTGGEQEAVCESRVRLARLDHATISAYVATGEPFGKAGGYAIQGRAAAFITRLAGSYSGVMGLPLFETAQLLLASGWEPHPG